MAETSRVNTGGGQDGWRDGRTQGRSKRQGIGPSRSRSSRRGNFLQLPPRRALIGGALVALAAMGVFVAHRSASTPPQTRFVVAARDIAAGTVIATEDLGSVALDMPDDIAAVNADDADDLIGRVASTNLSPLELVSSGDVYATGRFAEADSVEVAIDLPGARALAGIISAGSLVDVLSTHSDQGGTELLAAGVRVSSIGEARSGAIGASGSVRVVLSVEGTDTARALVDASLRADLTLILPRPGGEAKK
ncbi:MAG TPA: SAF domain-containing protein [Microthrixaceae bacterium]|nr:SAF domain-containing protein [Microthrixaceae bacterium]